MKTTPSPATVAALAAPRLLVLLALAAASLAGCGDGNEPGGQSGSETHFLTDCSQGCGAGYSCVCGVCTQACMQDSECQPLGAACFSSATLEQANACGTAPPPAPTSVCHRDCASDADCAALSNGHSCVGGFCVRPATSPPDSDVGADTPDTPDTPDTSACTDPVGAMCSVGEGVCAASGTMVCDETSGEVVCSATPGAPETGFCDGEDNDCDGTVDELSIALAAVPNAPPVDAAPWQLVDLDGMPYGAFQLGGDVVVLDLGSGTELAKIPGRAPRLFASKQGQRLVLFYVAPAPDETGTPQDEVHVAAVSLAGVVSAQRCVGCEDNLRSTKGGVLDYDAVFAGIDADQDGILDPTDADCTTGGFEECGYLSAYIRATNGTLHSARTDALTLAAVTNTEGVVLNFSDLNNSLERVEFVPTAPGLFLFAATRDSGAPGTRDLLVGGALGSSRVQVNRVTELPAAVPLGTDTARPFALAAASNGDALLVRRLESTVELSRLRPAAQGGGFELDYGPIGIAAPTDSAPSAPQLNVVDEDSALLALVFEARTSTGTYTSEFLTLDPADGSELSRAASQPGRLPVIDRYRLGTLAASDGTPVGDTTPLTPALAVPSCDTD